MLILISGATATRRRFDSPYLGCLIVPGEGNDPFKGQAWAADNGAFSGFDPEAFVLMLERLRKVEYSHRSCLFVAAPDVVGDYKRTLAKFSRWATVIRAFGFPVAFVAQNGITPEQVPWIEFDCLFIGGSKQCNSCLWIQPIADRGKHCPKCHRKLVEWKLSAEAETLARIAKGYRKWVHMGRVNSFKRVHHAIRIGCDSLDGTTFTKWSDKYIPLGIAWVERAHREPHLL